MSYLLQVVLSGISIGCIYGLVALGVVVIYSATRLLNFAQGEFLMIGGYAGWWALSAEHWPYAVAVLLVVMVGLLAGTVVSRVVVSPMLSRGNDTMAIVIATLAVSIVISQGFLRETGPGSRRVPSLLSGSPIRIGGASLTMSTASVCVGSFVALAVFAWIRSRTRTGLALRSVGANRIGAAILKINVRRVETISFALSGAVAAFGGLMITPITGWTPTMGLNVAIYGFIAAIVGGIASPYTGFLGGILIGVVSSVCQAYLPSSFPFADALVFASLIIVIAIRPGGLVPSLETRAGQLRS